MRELNKFKVLVISLITLIIIVALAFAFYFFSNSRKNLKDADAFTSMYDSTNTIKITVPNNLQFDKLKNNDYVLSIHSDADISINISQIEKKLPNTLKDYVSADKNTFPLKFENYNNISDIEACNTTNFLGYTYNFTNNEYFIKICWFEYNNYFYVVDIKLPNNIYSDYANDLNSIIHSISL